MLYIYVKHIVFKDNAMALNESLSNAGYLSKITQSFDYHTDNTYIIYGAHHVIEKFPKNYIIIQLEQSGVGYFDHQNNFINNDYKTFNRKYISILQKAKQVWDYSHENIKFLEKIKDIKIKYFPISYSPYLTQLNNIQNPIQKNIDVLFLGSLNQRRKNIIQKIKNKGLHIEVYNDLYDNDRLMKILSSKIILNIHYFENAILETHRLSYLFANKCFVISETSRDETTDQLFKNSLIFSNKNTIPDLCLEWSHPDKINKRNLISQIGYQTFKKIDYLNYIDTNLLTKRTISTHTQNIKTKKKNKKNRKNKKLQFYKPQDIQDAETIHNEENNLILKMININDDQLPFVTLITPTGNRRKMFSLPIRNYQSIIYPKNKIEWLIVDDGDEDLSDILPNDSNINYIKLNLPNRLPIGEKRNYCVQKAKYDYIAFMDDDDYYTPENLISRIKILLKYKNKSCVGCKGVGSYNLINNQSTFATDGSRYLAEATLAFKKSFWKQRPFNDQDLFAEYKYFQHQRQEQMISIPFQFVMIAFVHVNNLTKQTRVYCDFDSWLEKNKTSYSDLIKFFDIETKIFIHDLLKHLSIHNNKFIDSCF